MICPYCQQDDDKVIDSRAADGGESIRRRRECLACNRRYTTYERVEKTARLVVVKKDGSRTPFDAERILSGVQAACGKRPISEDDKRRIVREVEDEMHRDYEREAPSVDIGKRVAAKLRDVDQIAYIRYASEYYEYETLEDLATELSDLQARTRPLPNEVDLFPDGV